MKLLLRLLAGVAALAVVATGAALLYVYSRIEALPSGAAPQVSQPAQPRYARTATVALRELETLREDAGWPSISVAVGLGDQLVWAGTVGYADVASARPASIHDRYRVGGVAQPLTAVALGTLMDEGVIRLDSVVTELVDFPPKRAPFTVGQLASHTAGIRDYRDGLQGLTENFHRIQYDSVTAGLIMFADDPLLFEPGTDFHYSAYGYNLLSAALESAAGEDFLGLMQARVFGPAGMTATAAEHPPGSSNGPPPDLVTPYLVYERMLLRAPQINNSYRWAGGGFISTPTDLVRFGLALLDGSLVSAQTREQLWTVARLNDGTPSPGSYGLGFRIEEDEGQQLITHAGGSVGGISYFFIYPETGLVGAVTVNVSAGESMAELRAAVRGLAQNFLKVAPAEQEPVAESAEGLEAGTPPAGDEPVPDDPGSG